MKVTFKTGRTLSTGKFGIFARYAPTGQYYSTNFYYCTANVLVAANGTKTYTVYLPLVVPKMPIDYSFQVIIAYRSPGAPAWDHDAWYTSPWSFNISCSAPNGTSGSCGSSNGTTVTTKPTTGLCSDGSQPTVIGTSTKWMNEPCYYGEDPNCKQPPYLEKGSLWRWTCVGTAGYCSCSTLATDAYTCSLTGCSTAPSLNLLSPTNNQEIVANSNNVAPVNFSVTTDGCLRNGKLSYYKAVDPSKQRSIPFYSIPAGPATHPYVSPSSGTFLNNGAITYDPASSVTLPSGKKATVYYWAFQTTDENGTPKSIEQRKLYVLQPPQSPPPPPPSLKTSCSAKPPSGVAPLVVRANAGLTITNNPPDGSNGHIGQVSYGYDFNYGKAGMKKPLVNNKIAAYNTYPNEGFYQVYCTINVEVTYVNNNITTKVIKAVAADGTLVDPTEPRPWIAGNSIKVAPPGGGSGGEITQ